MKSLEKLKYTTKSANKKSFLPKWYEIDANDKIVGRLASRIVGLLSGKKYKVNYTPHVNSGDHVVVINTSNIKFTGKKEKDKKYIRHTGYPGGQKFTTPEELRKKDPARILRYSVKGMMMKNKLGRKLLGNLFIYPGTEHPHAAQKLEKINFKSI